VACELDAGGDEVPKEAVDDRGSLTPGTMLGDYEILAPIGAGGMGEVYRARDKTLGRDVAVKVLRPELAADSDRLKRFEQEARSASALNHPNIVHIYVIGEKAGTRYIAMEYVEGRTLRELLKEAPLPTEKIKGIASQVAAGLVKAHAAGIVHRDLKPENVMVTDDGYVKILDFGLVKLVGENRAVDSEMVTRDQLMTQQGVIVGTVQYMSPEQARGWAVDARSDQFSLGSILYEMATGERPFSRESFAQTMSAIIEDEPEPITKLEPETSAELAAIVGRCLKKEPSQRFEAMSELAQELTNVSDTPVRRSRRSVLWVAAGLLVAFIGVAIGLNVDRFRPSPTTPGIDSLVVLPVHNLSGDSEEDYLASGMTESMIADLAKIGALRVISRTSAMTFKDSEKPLSEIASELDVDAVIEASVLRVGDRVRVTAQLIDVERDEALWAQTYERDFANLLVLESEVARAVAEEIQVTLTPDEAMRLASGRPVDPEAHEAYLKGRFLLYKNTPEDTDEALRYFETALSEDPNYARAYVGIARVWAARQQYGWATPQEAGPRRVAAVDRALALDDDLAEAHYQLASVNTWTFWDFPAAEREFLRAIELDPNYPEARVFYARFLNFMNRPGEALPQIERALELDPRNSFFRGMYAVDLCWSRRYDDAIAEARRLLAEDPRQPFGHGALRIAYIGKGMLKEALEAQIALVEMLVRDDELVQLLKRGYDAGSYRDAWRAGAELLAARSGSGAFVPALDIALYYQAAGLPDEALDWMERAVEQRDPNVLGMRHPSSLDAIPGGERNPRVRALLDRIGLP